MGVAGNIANVLQRSGEVKSAAQPGDSYTEATVTAQDATNAAKLGPLGYVASPTTAWTAGQRIRVSGFSFSWNGTAWVAGFIAAPAMEQQTSGYDPADYTVAEVQAYVTAHPDEREAVLAAEQEGKGRVTLIDWLTGT